MWKFFDVGWMMNVKRCWIGFVNWFLSWLRDLVVMVLCLVWKFFRLNWWLLVKRFVMIFVVGLCS